MLEGRSQIFTFFYFEISNNQLLPGTVSNSAGKGDRKATTFNGNVGLGASSEAGISCDRGARD
jgi:hypothetical protein